MKFNHKKFINRLGVMALAGTQRRFTRKAPEKAERSGERLGRLLFRLSRKHRERALSNLAMAFPEMSEADRRRLAVRVFEHFGKIGANFAAGGKRSMAEIDADTEIVGLQNLEDALAKGKGVILITGHFGNWERMASWLSFHGYKLSVVARDANDPELNAAVNSLRAGPGTAIISRGQAARPIIQRLRKNELIGILPDQNNDEVFIPFFGKLAGATLGPGVIAERTGAAVIPCYGLWIAPGRYRVVFEPEMQAAPGYEVKGEGMMVSIHAFLERVIREHPEQWLWFHDRWRSARQKGLLG